MSSHLHLSVAYILICNELEKLVIKPDENTDVAWFETKMFTVEHFDVHDVYLYDKLIKRAKQYIK